MHTHRSLINLLTLAVISIAEADIPEHKRQATRPPTVDLGVLSNVSLHGFANGPVESFLNIRFGSDTSGPNRFAPPKSYVYPADSVINATSPGAACPQQKVPIPDLVLLDNVTNISEDCLTLRVDRPKGTSKDTRLPVMVYIYGGGDTFGQIYDDAYDPSALVSTATEGGSPIIYAAMNYRVGIFGFANSPALRAADSLNVGLLDQRLALEWIQENIAAFGGDPTRVTIFGESDGASGVGLQITAFGGKEESPPFRRAIMQSGAATADSGTAGNVSANHTAAIVQQTGCTASTSAAELLCLRTLSLETLLNVTVAYELQVAQWGLDVFIPTAPSSFIPDSPSKLLRSGRFARNIDIIAGWNEDDGSLFVPPTVQSDADVSAFLVQSFPALNSTSVQKALRLYPISEFHAEMQDNVSSQYFRASRMSRDATFTCPSILIVESNRDTDQRISGPCHSSPTNHLFVLNQTVFSAYYDRANTSYYGVSHFSDIPYVFNGVSTKFAEIATPADKDLAHAMVGSWTAFAATGRVDATRTGLSDWRSDEHSLGVRVIGGPNSAFESIDEYEDIRKRCNFWNSLEITEQLQI